MADQEPPLRFTRTRVIAEATAEDLELAVNEFFASFGEEQKFKSLEASAEFTVIIVYTI